MSATSQFIEIAYHKTCQDSKGTPIPFTSVYHYQRTATALPIVKGDIATRWHTAVGLLELGMVTSDCTEEDVSVRCIDDPLDPYTIQPFTGSGARPTPRLPLGIAFAWELRTGVRGRSYKGSKHLGPLSEADVSQDEIGGTAILTAIGLYQAAVIASFTDTAGNAWVPFVWSRTLSNMPPLSPADIKGSGVTLATYDKFVGSMRRRKETARR